MTEVTIRLSETTVRKIRAYNILAGGDAKNFEATLADMIDVAASQRIMEHVSEETITHAAMVPERQLPRHKLRSVVEQMPLFHDNDVSGISTGLGDDAPPDEEDEDKQVEAIMDDPYLSEKAPKGKPGKGGLTDEELAGDMDVSDPDHEAKADPGTFADTMSETTPEDLFAEAAGLPKPPVDQRVARRNHAKSVGGRRAKVRPMSENEG